MVKRMLLLAVVLVVVGLCGSAAFALDPMGPPVAGLGKGQFSAGVEYSRSKMDIKFNEGKCTRYMWDWSIPMDGTAHMGAPSLKIKDFGINKIYANLGYGMSDNWEVFARLGKADTELKAASFRDMFAPESSKFGDDQCSTWGFGTKATFYEAGDLKLGALFQVSWAQYDGKLTEFYTDPDGTDRFSRSVGIDITEIQIAVGPSYQLMENILIYGGPFFHIVDGDLEAKMSESNNDGESGMRQKCTWNVDERGLFGGYAGTQVGISENVSFNVEWQHTAAAEMLGMNLTWRF